MIDSSLRNLRYGQLAFVTLLAMQIAIRPDVLYGNDGISQFGILPSTALLYVATFLLSAIFLWRAAYRLPKSRDFAITRLGLGLSALLLVAITAFPAIGHGLIDHIHIDLAVGLFVVESLLGLWLLGRVSRAQRQPRLTRISFDRASVGLMVIQLGAGIVCWLALHHVLACQTESEIVFQLACSLLLNRSIGMLATRALPILS